MLFFNRMIVCGKRMLSQKLYILLLFSVVVLTAAYRLTPPKNKEAVIRVGLCFEEPSELSDALSSSLADPSNLYRFYTVKEKDLLLADVKRGYAECGYYFPKEFFEDYIAGTTGHKVIQYALPASVLSASINETVFSHLLTLTGGEIAATSIPAPELADALKSAMRIYLKGETIVKISAVTDGAYQPEITKHRLPLPIFELLIFMVVLITLLSQLTYLMDAESGRYTVLDGRGRMMLRFLLFFTAILPVLLLGTVSLLITEAGLKSLSVFWLACLIACPVALLVSTCIKKSISLLKMLPFTVLLTLVFLFMNTLTL